MFWVLIVQVNCLYDFIFSQMDFFSLHFLQVELKQKLANLWKSIFMQGTAETRDFLWVNCNNICILCVPTEKQEKNVEGKISVLKPKCTESMSAM